MRHHQLRFIFALSLFVAACGALTACNENTGSAGQQPGAKQTASPPANGTSATNAPNAANNGTNAPTAPATAANPAAAGANAFDVCALLTSDDIKAVQGEAVKESKPSRRDGTAFDVASCFYTTQTFTKSVSLEVTRRGTSPQSVHEFWEERVEKSGEEGEREREAERAHERKG